MKKVAEIDHLSWQNIALEYLVGEMRYPENEDVLLSRQVPIEIRKDMKFIEDRSIVGCLDTVKMQDTSIHLSGWFLTRNDELRKEERVVIVGKNIYIPMNTYRPDVRYHTKGMEKFIPLDDKIGFVCKIEKIRKKRKYLLDIELEKTSITRL